MAGFWSRGITSKRSWAQLVFLAFLHYELFALYFSVAVVYKNECKIFHLFSFHLWWELSPTGVHPMSLFSSALRPPKPKTSVLVFYEITYCCEKQGHCFRGNVILNKASDFSLHARFDHLQWFNSMHLSFGNNFYRPRTMPGSIGHSMVRNNILVYVFDVWLYGLSR